MMSNDSNPFTSLRRPEKTNVEKAVESCVRDGVREAKIYSALESCVRDGVREEPRRQNK